MALRFLPVLCIMAAGFLSAEVSVREDKVSLSVFDEGPLDVNPQFALFYGDYYPSYPYTVRTIANKTSHVEQFREIVLENEYLTCRVLPDLGGHIHGCTDKLTGREIFYANPAVRHAGDGQRGSFVPMGIESSFPIAHTPVSGSPVDFAYSNQDRVGRVVVEDTDRVTGMQWRVEFLLRSGVAVLEQRVTLHNGSAARHGFQWWVNAGIELDDPHLRFIYPVKWMVPHGDAPMTSWPLDSKGVDLSDVANHKERAGLFAHGSFEPWMAVYKPKFRGGIAHYADANVIRGKKVWLWGSDDKWVRENLTDKFNSYVEMQAGLFETQPEFAFLIPEGSKTFTHYWIPFHDLGGVARATPDAVLNIARNGRGATVEVQATHSMKARIRIEASDTRRVLLEAETDLDPKTVWSKAIEQAPGHVTVDILNTSGDVILHQAEGKYDGVPFDKGSPNPEPAPPSTKEASELGFLVRGLFNEQREQLAWAWGEYIAGLARFPSSVKLREAAGRVAFTAGRYEEAVRLLEPLAAGPIPYPADQYYYGVARARTGAPQQARTALSSAAIDPAWGPAARLQLALLAARGKDLTSAVQTIQALAAGPHGSSQTGAFEIALLRRAGKLDIAKQRLQFWRDQDPANNTIRVERTLIENQDDTALWQHLAADPQRVLDVVDAYLEIGAADDALKLLDRQYPSVPANEAEPGMVLPQNNPLIVYYRGYCRTLLGQSGDSDFKMAASLSTRYVFPHRASAYEVLKAAIKSNNSDPVAHDLLGDLYFDSLDSEHAIVEWRSAFAQKSDLPALARNLGRALLDVKGDGATARTVLQEAARLSPGDADITQVLTRAASAPVAAKNLALPSAATGRTLAPAPASSPTPAPPPPKAALPAPAKGDIATAALIRSVVEPEQAAAMFTPESFPKDKQPDAVRRAYIEVQLQRVFGMALTRKCGDALASLETLGDEDQTLGFTLYGFGSFMKAPHFEYYRGAIAAACGDEREAKKAWGRLPKPADSIKSAEDAFAYLALLNLGNAEARQHTASAIESLKKRIDGGDSSIDLVFVEGILLAASGQSAEGLPLLERAARGPDPMVQYMSLVALRGFPQN